MKTETSSTFTRVSADEIQRACALALERHGATPDDAEIQARHLLEGELRGHSSHGILRLSTLVGRLDNGLIVSGVEPELVWSGSAALQVDGRCGFGPVVANRVLDELIPKAAMTGVAVAAIRNSQHLGMLAPYVERVTEAGSIGIILTTSEALVHPWHGARALVGTNPIAIGVPSAAGTLCLDMSTGAVSAGKILDYAARNQPIPEGWAVDSEGHPTTDPQAAVTGAISPFGGAKGYALGIAFESIVGFLTRTAFGTDVTGTLDTTHPSTKGDLFIVLSPAVFGAGASETLLGEYFNIIRTSGADGARVSIPGDRVRLTRMEALTDGLDLDANTWNLVLDLAKNGHSHD